MVLLLALFSAVATAKKNCLADFNAEVQDTCELVSTLTETKGELDTCRSFVLQQFGADAMASEMTEALFLFTDVDGDDGYPYLTQGDTFAAMYNYVASKYEGVTEEAPLVFTFKYVEPLSGNQLDIEISNNRDIKAVMRLAKGRDVIPISVAHVAKPVMNYHENSGAWSKKGWDVVYYVYDRAWRDDIPDRWSDIAAGFQWETSFYIGNSELEKIAFDKVEMCVEHYGDWEDWTMCQEIQGKVDVIKPDNEMGTCKDAISQVSTKQRKAIVGLTGQCPLGSAAPFVGNDLLFCDPSVGDVAAEWKAAKPRCWQCHPDSGHQPTIYPHSRENWHYWGCGLSMAVQGFEWSNVLGGGYEKNDGREFGQHANGPCHCNNNALNHWDTFYIRVHTA